MKLPKLTRRDLFLYLAATLFGSWVAPLKVWKDKFLTPIAPSIFDAGYFYCPYIPLTTLKIIPEMPNFIKTRYSNERFS